MHPVVAIQPLLAQEPLQPLAADVASAARDVRGDIEIEPLVFHLGAQRAQRVLGTTAVTEPWQYQDRLCTRRCRRKIRSDLSRARAQAKRGGRDGDQTNKATRAHASP